MGRLGSLLARPRPRARKQHGLCHLFFLARDWQDKPADDETIGPCQASQPGRDETVASAPLCLSGQSGWHLWPPWKDAAAGGHDRQVDWLVPTSRPAKRKDLSCMPDGSQIPSLPGFACAQLCMLVHKSHRLGGQPRCQRSTRPGPSSIFPPWCLHLLRYMHTAHVATRGSTSAEPASRPPTGLPTTPPSLPLASCHVVGTHNATPVWAPYRTPLLLVTWLVYCGYLSLVDPSFKADISFLDIQATTACNW